MNTLLKKPDGSAVLIQKFCHDPETLSSNSHSQNSLRSYVSLGLPKDNMKRTTMSQNEEKNECTSIFF